MGSSGPLARVPHPAPPDDDSYGASMPADGTMSGDSIRRSADGTVASKRSAGDLLIRPARMTTAIPERSITVDHSRSAAAVDDDDQTPEGVHDQTPEGVPGPRTGRAAMRAERQAADMARRKAVKRSGGPASALPDDEDDVRRPRGIVKGLAAMAVVGLSVLGVYTWAAPVPQDAAAQSSSISRTAPSAASPSQLPPLPTEPVAVEPTVAAPVRVPVTVLNATDIDGLAGKISTTVVGAGWESPGVGAYEGNDVAVSTVFFTEGDENQRQAALQLIEQFPQLSGPAPRFFELPADVTVPGLVIVAAGEWVP
ncbi:MAG: LytR C-terminal domain-containing protein [Actinomycetota bacterium]|nr:LytR C-terminal domain-containing protein [Actinomycetota bacterium]